MSFFSRSATPRWFRFTCAATAMSFTWTFVLSTPIIALAQGPAKQTKPSAPKPLAPWKPGKRMLPPLSLKQNLTPLTNAQSAALKVKRPPHPSISLFDTDGHLMKSATPIQIAQWKSTPKTSHSSEEKARLHLWLGEAASTVIRNVTLARELEDASVFPKISAKRSEQATTINYVSSNRESFSRQ